MTNNELDGVETIWGKRAGIEKELFKVLLSGNIDAKWKNLTDALAVAKWSTQDFLDDFTEAFLNLNEAYIYKFYKG